MRTSREDLLSSAFVTMPKRIRFSTVTIGENYKIIEDDCGDFRCIILISE